jgi:sulfate transport system permease protein
MLRAATALAVADPEEADANGMFAAIKEYDEISNRKLEYDAQEVFVGAVTGHIREGLFADNAVAQQFDELMSQTKCDAVILVSDGNEDEHVLPILQTRVKVNGVRRVIVKQARTLEGVLGLFNRLIHDQKLQRRFFLPLAILLFAAGAAILLKRPELFVAAGLFLAAVYIMVQVLNLGRPLGGLMHGISVQMRTGKLSLFASVVAFFIVVAGGIFTMQQVEPASEVGTPRYSVLFAQSMFWYIVGAVALILIGRGMDRKVRGEDHAGRHWERLLFVLGGATFAYAVLQPLAIVGWRTFENGVDPAWQALSHPDTLHAFRLTLIVTAIAVPVNTVFGIVCALAIVRRSFPGKGVLNAFVDLPLALSPVVVGLALFLLYGREGWFGGWLEEHDVQFLFALPSMVVATIFVSIPFVAREVVPTLRELGDEQEQAARTLGASGWQTFRRITLPSIRWAVIYGVILTTARCLGEYGAVAVVSGRLQGETETATLRVQERYESFDLAGAYAISIVLAAIAVLVLLTMTRVRPREEHA